MLFVNFLISPDIGCRELPKVELIQRGLRLLEITDGLRGITKFAIDTTGIIVGFGQQVGVTAVLIEYVLP